AAAVANRRNERDRGRARERVAGALHDQPMAIGAELKRSVGQARALEDIAVEDADEGLGLRAAVEELALHVLEALLDREPRSARESGAAPFARDARRHGPEMHAASLLEADGFVGDIERDRLVRRPVAHVPIVRDDARAGL